MTDMFAPTAVLNLTYVAKTAVMARPPEHRLHIGRQ